MHAGDVIIKESALPTLSGLPVNNLVTGINIWID